MRRVLLVLLVLLGACGPGQAQWDTANLDASGEAALPCVAPLAPDAGCVDTQCTMVNPGDGRVLCGDRLLEGAPRVGWCALPASATECTQAGPLRSNPLALCLPCGAGYCLSVGCQVDGDCTRLGEPRTSSCQRVAGAQWSVCAPRVCR